MFKIGDGVLYHGILGIITRKVLRDYWWVEFEDNTGALVPLSGDWHNGFDQKIIHAK